MWSKQRILAAAAITVGGLSSVFAGAAWAPPTDTSPSSFGGVRLVVDGAELAAFSRCLGLGTETDVIEYKVADGSGNQAVTLQPGTTRAGKIVCERGVSSDLSLSAWRESVAANPTAARKDGVFVLFDAAGAPLTRWQTRNMWPSELTYHFSGSTGREVVTFVSESTTRTAS